MDYHHDVLSEGGLKLFTELLGDYVPELQDVDTMVCDLPALKLIGYFKGCQLLQGLEFEDQIRLVQCWSLGPRVDSLRNTHHLLVMIHGGGTLYSIKQDLSIEELVMKAGTAVILPNYLPHSFIADNRQINQFAMIQIVNEK